MQPIQISVHLENTNTRISSFIIFALLTINIVFKVLNKKEGIPSFYFVNLFISINGVAPPVTLGKEPFHFSIACD